ncbi:MAG: FxsA family protein [Bacteroidetes bacterium]|nr:FxsA family protein [Bacteroidota bacterium]
MSRLFLLFVVVPLVELALLIRVGELIGFWPTVGIVVATAALGSSLARREGFSAFARFQQALAGQRPVVPELLDGLIILASAVLLLTPGIITDIVGLLGLFPATRPLIRSAIQKRFKVKVFVPGQSDPSEVANQEPVVRKAGEHYETTMSGSASRHPTYRQEDTGNQKT